MTYLKAYLGTTLVFFVVDAIWIALVVRAQYRREVGHLLLESPNLLASALFYLAYTAGILALAVHPALTAGSLRTALVSGAILGAVAYGTFAVTNFAVLQGWTIQLVLSDVAWGTFLTALCAGCGYLAARAGS